jgi:predicted unusual protein kinase regulating ubiquinone biosynthesis (AarF/ABC1/UbiB family)
MLRAFHVTTTLGFHSLKGSLGLSASDSTACLQQLGGIYSKLSQSARITDPNDVIYNECKQVNEQETKQRLLEHIRAHTELSSVTDCRLVGTGSVGAVYSLTLGTGQHLICKVQYVGIRQLWIDDIKALKAALRSKNFLSGTDQGADMVGFERLMETELDYVHECKHTQAVFEMFVGHPHIMTPQPWPTISSSTVLAMSPVQGESMLWFLEHATDTEKVVIATLLAEFYHTTLSQHRVYCDYHWGNMRVQDRTTLIMLDFGMMEVIDVQNSELYSTYLYCAYLKRHDLFEQTLRRYHLQLLPQLSVMYALYTHLALPYYTKWFVFTSEYLKILDGLHQQYNGAMQEYAWTYLRSHSTLVRVFQHMHVTVSMQTYLNNIKNMAVKHI